MSAGLMSLHKFIAHSFFLLVAAKVQTNLFVQCEDFLIEHKLVGLRLSTHVINPAL
jgi:hypothetical protein